ncbi:MAG: hypothetical protein D4Q79_00480 [Spirochaetia bacterium]|nr:MAG: hypothetical protein D4Q79_00480 [Spirochaetia bacterium]
MNFNLNNIPLKTRNLLQDLSGQKFMKNFYLAGGTAIALFFKHRQSQDLDFFTEKSFSSSNLIKNLKTLGIFQGFKNSEDTLTGSLNEVKVSFFSLPYGLLNKPIKYGNLRIADIIDLALMKILAISDRGTKRDFIDLYFICQKVKPLDEFLFLFQKKFGKYDYNIHHIIKSLTYFDDAEKDKMPKMHISVEWNEIKKFFTEEKPKLARKFLIGF